MVADRPKTQEAGLQRSGRHRQVCLPGPPARNCQKPPRLRPVSAAVAAAPRIGSTSKSLLRLAASVPRDLDHIRWGCSGLCFSLPGRLDLQGGGSLVASDSSGCRRWTLEIVGRANSSSETTTTRPLLLGTQRHWASSLPPVDCQSRLIFSYSDVLEVTIKEAP